MQADHSVPSDLPGPFCLFGNFQVDCQGGVTRIFYRAGFDPLDFFRVCVTGDRFDFEECVALIADYCKRTGQPIPPHIRIFYCVKACTPKILERCASLAEITPALVASLIEDQAHDPRFLLSVRMGLMKVFTETKTSRQESESVESFLSQALKGLIDVLEAQAVEDSEDSEDSPVCLRPSDIPTLENIGLTSPQILQHILFCDYIADWVKMLSCLNIELKRAIGFEALKEVTVNNAEMTEAFNKFITQFRQELLRQHTVVV